MCICGQLESMEHIWNCEKLSSDKNEERNYQKIFNGNIKEQIEIFEEFTKKLERYKEQSEKTQHPGDPCKSDPLFYVEQRGIK